MTKMTECQNIMKRFKILTIGDTNVGKSSLLFRDKKLDIKNTIGVDYIMKQYTINGTEYNLDIWDTAGQERFRAITRAYYRDAQAIFIVFDLSNYDSFMNISHWIEDINKNNPGDIQPLKILIGNKSDLKPHSIKREHINQVVKKHGLSKYIETSAKTGENVEAMFMTIIDLLKIKTLHTTNPQFKLNTISMLDTLDTEKNQCC
jgi:small GTP-binding protein